MPSHAPRHDRLREFVRRTPIEPAATRIPLLDLMRRCAGLLMIDGDWRDAALVTARRAPFFHARVPDRDGVPRPPLTPVRIAESHLARLRALSRERAPARLATLPRHDLLLLGCWAAYSQGDWRVAGRLAGIVARYGRAPRLHDA